MAGEDLTLIQAAMTQIRDMNAVSLVFRRDTTALPAQTVRVERQGTQARLAAGTASEQAEGDAVVLGATALNIQPGDRFTLDGRLYEVVFVAPDRRAATQASAQMVE